MDLGRSDFHGRLVGLRSLVETRTTGHLMPLRPEMPLGPGMPLGPKVAMSPGLALGPEPAIGSVG